MASCPSPTVILRNKEQDKLFQEWKGHVENFLLGKNSEQLHKYPKVTYFFNYFSEPNRETGIEMYRVERK